MLGETHANTVDTNTHESEEEDKQRHSVFGAITAYTVFLMLFCYSTSED